jgi:diguanylate cyclase (GGDEF)-like protein
VPGNGRGCRSSPRCCRCTAPTPTGRSSRSKDITERRHRAASDPLTGLANRARAGAPPGALLFCDLDDFKSINDVFGHLAGDAVLRACAGRMTAHVRAGDGVFRLGGDEFAIVLHAVPPVEVTELVERIKKVVAEPVEHEGRRLTVTVSVGAAVIDSSVASVDGLLAAADAAMYVDKRRVG